MSLTRRQVITGLGAIAGGGAAVDCLGATRAAAAPREKNPSPTASAPASSYDPAALGGILAAYFSDRARRVSLDSPALAETSGLELLPTLQRGYKEEMPLLEQQARRSAMFYGGYRSAHSTVALGQLHVDGSAIFAEVAEHTTLYFRRTDITTAIKTEYLANHRAVFLHSNAGWKLNSIEYMDEEPLSAPITQFFETVPDHIKTYISQDREVLANRYGSAARAVPYDAGTPRYDTQRMVDYAHRWWNSQNPAYPRFGGEEDCTNFVSQCMHAGGWPIIVMTTLNPRTDDGSWFFGPLLQSCSYSWTAAQNLYQHDWKSNMARWAGPIGAPPGSQMLWRSSKPGSNFEHAQIVTGLINNGTPLLTQHAPPYVDKPLQDIAATETDDFWALVDPSYDWALPCPIRIPPQ